MRLPLALFLLLSGGAANADILFLDMNDGPMEVAAAQRAAAKRGEKLIVWPESSPEVKALEVQVRAARTRFVSAERACVASSPESSACGTNMEAASNAYSALASKLEEVKPRFDERQLAKALQEQSKQGVKVSSVIISGHDGNGMFSGVNGGIGSKGIKEAFAKVPSLRDGVRSIGLWGCYTTTMGQVEGNWKHVFPNSSLVAGYDGSAPANTRLASATYLEDVLAREAQLLKITDRNELNKAFRSLRNVTATHASLCLNHDLFVSVDGKPTSISEELGACKPSAKDEQSEAKMNCYLNGEEGCTDVPSTTGAGPLREFYNSLQASSHCDETLRKMSINRPSRDVLIRLIFDKQVRANFKENFKDELNYLDEMLEKLNAPKEMRFVGLDKMTRKNFLDQVKALKSYLNERYKALNQIEDPAARELAMGDYEELTSAQRALSALGSLSPGEIPFGWVEPNATEKSEGYSIPAIKNLRYTKQMSAARMQLFKLKDEAIKSSGANSQALAAAEAQQAAANRAYDDFEPANRNSRMSAADEKKYEELRKVSDAAYEAYVREANAYRRPGLVKYSNELKQEITSLKAQKTPEAVLEVYEKALRDVQREIEPTNNLGTWPTPLPNAGGDRVVIPQRPPADMPEEIDADDARGTQ